MISEEGRTTVDSADAEYFAIAKEVRSDAKWIREWFLNQTEERESERDLLNKTLKMITPERRLQCVRGCMSEAILGLLHCAYSAGDVIKISIKEQPKAIPQTPGDITCIQLADRFLTASDRHIAVTSLNELIKTTHPSYVLSALLQLRTPTQSFLGKVLYSRQLSDLLDVTIESPQGITSLVNTLLNGLPDTASAAYHNVVKIVITVPRCAPSYESHFLNISPQLISMWSFVKSNLTKTPPHLYHFFSLVMDELRQRFKKLFFKHIVKPVLLGLELDCEQTADSVTKTIEMVHCLLICSKNVVVSLIEAKSHYLANLLSLYTLVRESVLYVKSAVLEIIKEILQACKPAVASQVIIKYLRDTSLREQRELYEYVPSDTGGVEIMLSTFERKKDQTRLVDQHYIDSIVCLLTNLKKQSDIPGELILQIIDSPSSDPNPILFTFALQIISDLGIRVLTSGGHAGRIISVLLQDPSNEENTVTGLTLLQLAVGDKLMMSVTTEQVNFMISKIEQITAAADPEIHQMASSCLILLREFNIKHSVSNEGKSTSLKPSLSSIMAQFSKIDSGAAYNPTVALSQLDEWCDDHKNKPSQSFSGNKSNFQFLLQKVNEIPNTAPEKDRRLAADLRDKLLRYVTKSSGYSSIVQLFADGDTASTGHALVEMKNWIADNKNNSQLMSNFDDIFSLLMGFLADDESYLYLSAENALMALCDAATAETLELLSNSYSRTPIDNNNKPSGIREARRKRSVAKKRRMHSRDFRLQNDEEECNRLLKMADLIIYCVERGGEGCREHGVIEALISRCHHSSDSAVRASSLQVIGQFALHSRWLLLPHLRLIITTAQSIISLDKFTITLRASASLLYHVFCSFSTEAVTVLSEFIPSILEISVANEYCTDAVTARYFHLLIKQANAVRMSLYGMQNGVAQQNSSW